MVRFSQNLEDKQSKNRGKPYEQLKDNHHYYSHEERQPHVVHMPPEDRLYSKPERPIYQEAPAPQRPVPRQEVPNYQRPVQRTEELDEILLKGLLLKRNLSNLIYQNQNWIFLKTKTSSLVLNILQTPDLL